MEVEPILAVHDHRLAPLARLRPVAAAVLDDQELAGLQPGGPVPQAALQIRQQGSLRVALHFGVCFRDQVAGFQLPVTFVQLGGGDREGAVALEADFGHRGRIEVGLDAVVPLPVSPDDHFPDSLVA